MGYKEGEEPVKTYLATFEDGGIEMLKKKLSTGEERHITRNEGGLSVSITVCPKKHGYWQNTHRHDHSIEIYGVSEGVIRIICLDRETGQFMSGENLFSGDIMTIKPGVVHRTFVGESSVFSVMKIPVTTNVNGDWIGHPEFDQITG